MMKWIAAALVALALPQEVQFGNSYLGKAPPELVSDKSQWLNSAEALTFEKLKGRPVWLEFGFLKCGPCKKMKPTLFRWQKEYAEKGLAIIDVSDGEMDKFDDLKKEVEEKAGNLATLWDKGAKNCLAYGIQAYPMAYLVGVDGKVIWEGSPNAKIAEIEALIRKELEKAKK
jgi:thiol-disulfide isomerase/thioredoxin